MGKKPDLSIVLGTKNRKNLLKATINSIRKNEFNGKMEIIVVDGGSKDGTCNWLAKQKDILTIIQPNYVIKDQDEISILAHSWGEFMNIAFKQAKAQWILMVSDDLILARGAIQNGYDELINRSHKNEKIGGGAIYFREYPRHKYYRIVELSENIININHGFYNKNALIDVDYIEEDEFNFYCADGDLIMKMVNKGWKIIKLESSFANHLVHKPVFSRTKFSKATIRDISNFKRKYLIKSSKKSIKNNIKIQTNIKAFWMYGFINCVLGIFLRIYDKYYKND